MSTKKVILMGCGTVLLGAVTLVALIIGWVVYISQDLEGVSVTIDSPLDVKVGEIFQLTVNIENERETKNISLSDVDISDSFLNGFSIISTDPISKSSSHIPIANCMSYTFNTTIPAGATKSIIFTLRAEQKGIFRGDVDICEGQRFITTTAQTIVNE